MFTFNVFVSTAHAFKTLSASWSFRRQNKRCNNFINIGLKGNTYEFAIKLDKILTYDVRRDLEKSKYWLWTIRYLLHQEARREEDRL